MSKITTISEAGIHKLALHEGIVHGIYDCPAHHATYGIGTLVHHGRSQLLRIVSEAALTDPTALGKLAAKLKRHLKLYQPSSKTPTPYLAAEIGEDEHYRQLVKLLLDSKSSDLKAIVLENSILTEGWDSYMTKFGERLSKFERAVAETFSSIELDQDQFDGLVSIAYNIGERAMRQSGNLVAALKQFCSLRASPKATKIQHDQAAATLLDAVLRARPTARALVPVQIEDNSFDIMQAGVFNAGLFNRRIAEASLIIGKKYSAKDSEIIIAKMTIKAEKDHFANERARTEATAVVQMLRIIRQSHRNLP